MHICSLNVDFIQEMWVWNPIKNTYPVHIFRSFLHVGAEFVWKICNESEGIRETRLKLCVCVCVCVFVCVCVVSRFAQNKKKTFEKRTNRELTWRTLFIGVVIVSIEDTVPVRRARMRMICWSTLIIFLCVCVFVLSLSLSSKTKDQSVVLLFHSPCFSCLSRTVCERSWPVYQLQQQQQQTAN